MTKYVIRGGEKGKAGFCGSSPMPSGPPAAAYSKAPVSRVAWLVWMSALCGGGHVTLAMARLVGPSGMVTGVDVDRVKLGLAQ